MFSAVENSISNAGGVFMPALVLWIQRRTKSWMPVLWFAIAGQVVQMIIYRTIVPSTLVSARRQLHLG